MQKCDFPAAHSMDSGWFAVDNDGKLAHFETGEAGALASTPYSTGESSNGQAQELYITYIAPWIARHFVSDEDLAYWFGEALVFFERDEDAVAFARTTDEVTLVAGRGELLQIVGKDKGDMHDDDVDPYEALFACLVEAPGFIGLAPSSLYDFFEMYDHPDADLKSPVSFYHHGDWDTPGHYVRRAAAAHDAIQDAPGFSLDTVFAERQEIQLAEIANNFDFIFWGDGDLSGYPPPPPPRTPPGKAFWSWLSGLFGDKKGEGE